MLESSFANIFGTYSYSSYRQVSKFRVELKLFAQAWYIDHFHFKKFSDKIKIRQVPIKNNFQRCS